ncbi:MAG: AsnC family transcriptional regulator [Nitrososphaerales archaeon]
MDELDVKILRALMSEGAVAPSEAQVGSSLRSIAERLGADDMTVNYRYRRLQESGAMSGWRLIVNPTFFGCRVMDVTVDVEPEAAKADMIRKLKLVHEVTGMIDFYGRALKLIVVYNGEESRSRTIELISRITNAERMTQVRWALPQCRTERMSETDVAIVRALSSDARKSFVRLSKELGLSTRTVRNRVRRLRMGNTVFALASLEAGSIPGLIPVYLSYSYAQNGVKGTVDRAMLSHFEASYLTVLFTDPASGWVSVSASTMADVQGYLEWARSQPGVASARVDLLTKTMMFPEKLVELLRVRRAERSDISD